MIVLKTNLLITFQKIMRFDKEFINELVKSFNFRKNSEYLQILIPNIGGMNFTGQALVLWTQYECCSPEKSRRIYIPAL